MPVRGRVQRRLGLLLNLLEADRSPDRVGLVGGGWAGHVTAARALLGLAVAGRLRIVSGRSGGGRAGGGRAGGGRHGGHTLMDLI